MDESKPVASLTEAEIAAFDKSNACRNACQKVVMEAIKHYEWVEIEQLELWRAVKTKYDLPINKDYVLRGGEVFMFDSSKKTIKDLVEKLEASSLIRKEVFKVFGLEEPKND